ncbi:hypothetical protein MKZ38_008493 [Zalerion maritima]|uniref:Clr5 domain-containing protein n=1 Tax=Zalerion maritima TaxID=339359 RepID=A0AAD5RGM4_9PEZI|nr:hypothetical protein MKZ38_008493 [Zalerion maritima]
MNLTFKPGYKPNSSDGKIRIDWNKYKDIILEKWESGSTLENIMDFLEVNRKVKVKRTPLHKHIQKWSSKSKRGPYQKTKSRRHAWSSNTVIEPTSPIIPARRSSIKPPPRIVCPQPQLPPRPLPFTPHLASPGPSSPLHPSSPNDPAQQGLLSPGHFRDYVSLREIERPHTSFSTATPTEEPLPSYCGESFLLDGTSLTTPNTLPDGASLRSRQSGEYAYEQMPPHRQEGGNLAGFGQQFDFTGSGSHTNYCHCLDMLCLATHPDQEPASDNTGLSHPDPNMELHAGPTFGSSSSSTIVLPDTPMERFLIDSTIDMMYYNIREPDPTEDVVSALSSLSMSEPESIGDRLSPNNSPRLG